MMQGLCGIVFHNVVGTIRELQIRFCGYILLESYGADATLILPTFVVVQGSLMGFGWFSRVLGSGFAP